MTGVLFLVSGATQARDAAAVARRLDVPALALGLATGLVRPAAEAAAVVAGAAHAGSPGRTAPRALRAFTDVVRRRGRLVVATGQDFGAVQRLLLGRAVAHGLPTALLPDGAVATPRPDGARGPRLRHVPAAAATRFGVLPGDGRAMGSTRPDRILSWGSGWSDLWERHAPGVPVVVTGSARSDELAASVRAPAPDGPRLLVGSQPLAIPRVGASAAEVAGWYAWVRRVAGDFAEVRVRLHPMERERPELHAATADLPTDEGPVADALDWCTHVVTTASTMAIEAAGLGRGVLLVRTGPAVARMWSESPFFSEAAWVRVDVAAPLDPADVARAEPLPELGAAYYRCDGRAAERIAAELAELVLAAAARPDRRGARR